MSRNVLGRPVMSACLVEFAVVYTNEEAAAGLGPTLCMAAAVSSPHVIASKGALGRDWLNAERQPRPTFFR